MRVEPWNGLAAGIGRVGFLYLKIDEISLEILARMPIMPTKKTEYESTRTAYCISVPKHYGKPAVRRRELRSGVVPGRQLHDTPLSWGSIRFETSHPESIIKTEFYIAKILGAIRRKVKLHRGCSYVGSRGKDIVFLKDVTDNTDLIAFATSEWEKHKSKQRRRNK
jgi:hypothetical protein